MSKKAIVWGSVFGIFAPLIGLFLGLQVAPVLGNILLFPVLGLSALFDTPIGMFSTLQKILVLVVSVIGWALLFSMIERAITYTKARTQGKDGL